MTTPTTAPECPSCAAGALRHSLPSLDGACFGFGGIQARYRDHPGRVLRTFDPFTGVLVEFGSPLQHENWLLRRFDPSVIFLDPAPGTWEVLHLGDQLAVKPHLHWAGWSDKGFLEIVEEPGRKVSNAVLDALEIIARAHGLKPLLRVAAQVRADAPLLDLLDRARQNLVLHMAAVRDIGLRKRVLDAVADRSHARRSDVIRAARTSVEDAAVDAILFWLRQTGAVQFDFEGGRYDDHTAICAA